jgi:lysophospholipase L1-like esterase
MGIARRRNSGLFLPLLFAAGCGGGGAPPTTPATPSPQQGFTVQAVLFYDENGSGVLDGAEPIRIPDVEVTIGGHSARTAKRTGQVQVTGVPAGTFPLGLRGETLPPFFVVGPSPSITVPTPDGMTVPLSARLPIGRNRPNEYVAFGDSLTAGDGVASSQAWPARLQTLLEQHFGGALVRNRGASGTNSFEALERFSRNIDANEPAYTLILYGTNDWNDPECQDDPDCYTVDNLRTVVRRVKALQSLPFIATLPPVNPALTPAGRNDWVAAVNDRIRAMARDEGAFVVDLHATFMRQPSLPPLYLDHVHFSPAGHDLAATAWFEAIAHGRSSP